MLIEFCIYGRNDDYMPDFIYRLETSISHFIKSVTEIDKTSDYLLTVVDWGSSTPLSDVVEIMEPTSEMVCFSYISPKQIKEIGIESKGIPASLPINLAIRRSTADFIFVMGADTVLTSSSLLSLHRLCSGDYEAPFPIKNSFLMIERKQVPWKFFIDKPDHLELDRMIKLSSFAFRSDAPSMHWGGGAGILGMHREAWIDAQGLDERVIEWGNNDVELFLNRMNKMKWLELSSFGICSYHMEHLPPDIGATREKRINTTKCFEILKEANRPNIEDWGLPNLKLKNTPYKRNVITEKGNDSKRKKQDLNKVFEKGLIDSRIQELITFLNLLAQDLSLNIKDKESLERLFLIDFLFMICRMNKIVTFDTESPENFLICTNACSHAEILSICKKDYESIGDLTQIINQYRTTTQFRGHPRFVTDFNQKNCFLPGENFDLIVMGNSSSEELCKLLMSKIKDDGIILIPTSSKECFNSCLDGKKLEKHKTVITTHGNTLVIPDDLYDEFTNSINTKDAVDLLSKKMNAKLTISTIVKNQLYRSVKKWCEYFGVGIYRLKNNSAPPVFD